MSSPSASKFALLLALLVLSFARAEDAPDKAGWKLKLVPVPPGALLSREDSDKPLGERKMDEKLKPVLENDYQFDMRDYLRACGVQMPEGSSAIFDRRRSAMALYGPVEVVDAAETLWLPEFGPGGELAIEQLRIDVVLAECVTAKDVVLDGLAYDELRKAVGTKWRELRQATLLTKRAEKTVLEQVTRKPALERSHITDANHNLVPMSAGDRGLQIEMELVLGPDEISVWSSLSMEHRGPVGENGPVLDAKIVTEMRGWLDSPLVVAIWTIGPLKSDSKSVRRVALVVCPHVVDGAGHSKTTPMK